MRISDWSSDVCSSDLIDAHCTLPSLDIHFKGVKIACHGFRRKVRTNIGKAIDAAIKVDAFPDQRVGRRLIGQIELHRLGRAAGGGDPLDRCPRTVLIDITNNDLRAFARQPLARCCTDSRTACGDYDTFSVKSVHANAVAKDASRSEEHTSELQSLMRISYAVFCLKKKTNTTYTTANLQT